MELEPYENFNEAVDEEVIFYLDKLRKPGIAS
jgi:hypothetical protein